jgi:hypothetical protein
VDNLSNFLRPQNVQSFASHNLSNISVIAPRRQQDWLLALVHKFTHRQLNLQHYNAPRQILQLAVDARFDLAMENDWETVQAICGFSQEDFIAAAASLPLTAAVIQHFCRNHRDNDPSLAGQFESLGQAIPEPLAILYSIYHTQARLDAEATLFLAQTSCSTRVPQQMADLLTIGGFNHGDKSIHCEGRVYAIATAFDTATVIDAVCKEAKERLQLPADHHDHLLQLCPEAIGLLAAQLSATHRLPPLPFFHKSHLLAEARQDVNRFAPRERFGIALYEGDLPVSESWVQRLVKAMKHIAPSLAGQCPPTITSPRQAQA